MQMTIPGTLESRMRGNVQVRFGRGLSEKGGNAPRRESTSPFKRAAVKFGVARYLYRDGVPTYAQDGALTVDHAEPTAITEPAPAAKGGSPAPQGGNGNPPRSGKALFAWTVRRAA